MLNSCIHQIMSSWAAVQANTLLKVLIPDVVSERCSVLAHRPGFAPLTIKFDPTFELSSRNHRMFRSLLVL